jgi:type III restriction enzyme
MATKRAATKASANAASTSGASLDFAFFRFLWRFYQDNRGAIRQN